MELSPSRRLENVEFEAQTFTPQEDELAKIKKKTIHPKPLQNNSQRVFKHSPRFKIAPKWDTVSYMEMTKMLDGVLLK